MIDYSKLSDQEINQAIGKIVSRDGMSIIASDGNAVIHEYADCGEFSGICLGWKVFDPCNNPSDAWPIILQNRISIGFDADGASDDRTEWVTASNQFFSGYLSCEKALRAAMIVFLKMQDEKIG